MPKHQFQITVEPQYLPAQSQPEQRLYGFSYTITVVNVGDVAAQLIARHWIIRDARGHIEEVKGLGVVGQQPLLKPGESFRYTSGCRLRTPNGTMQGSYFCVGEDATRFDATIPLFVLEAYASPMPGDGTPRVLH